MADYIDRQAIRDAMYHEAFETDSDMQRWDGGCWIRYKMFENVIDRLPSADVVDVVRCKDCKHYRPYVGILDGYCHMAEWYKRYQYENDYCSRGERKDG